MPSVGSLTPVLEKDSINIGVMKETDPLGRPVLNSSLVSDAPAAGIVILDELVETILLSRGTVDAEGTDLYKPPAFVSIQISSKAEKVGAPS